MASVHFQRVRKLSYGARGINVVVDGYSVAVIYNGEDLEVDIPTGEHLLRLFVGKRCLAKYELYIPDDIDYLNILLEAPAAGGIEAFSGSDCVLRRVGHERNNGFAASKRSRGLSIVICTIIGLPVVAIILASLFNTVGKVKISIVPSITAYNYKTQNTAQTSENSAVNMKQKELLPEGGVFKEGSYIVVSDIEILYHGKTDYGEAFSITNNSMRPIVITASVVGVKSDGTFQEFQWPAFSGVDKWQYENDLQENGWAIEQYTNRVRVGETLEATMTIISMDGYPEPDIDGDGYYDIVFTIYPQKDDDSLQFSTNAPESAVYKLRAK